MAIINTKQELIEKLDKEGISRDWYSFDGNADKIVSFDGEYVYYHGLKSRIKNDEHYYFMYFELAKYKSNQEFYDSDKIMRAYSVEILTDDGGFLNRVCAHGKYELIKLRQSYYDERDDELLSQGYSFDRYVAYDGTSYYHKRVDSSAFSEMVIEFEKKTTQEEIEKYGLKYSIQSTSLRYPIPQALREKIVAYIDRTAQLEIKEPELIQEIANYFTEAKLLQDELERLDEYQTCLSKALQEEVLRQQQLGIQEREALLEVYRSIARHFEKTSFGWGRAEDRSFAIKERCLREAEETLGVSKKSETSPHNTFSANSCISILKILWSRLKNFKHRPG